MPLTAVPCATHTSNSLCWLSWQSQIQLVAFFLASANYLHIEFYVTTSLYGLRQPQPATSSRFLSHCSLCQQVAPCPFLYLLPAISHLAVRRISSDQVFESESTTKAASLYLYDQVFESESTTKIASLFVCVDCLIRGKSHTKARCRWPMKNPKEGVRPPNHTGCRPKPKRSSLAAVCVEYRTTAIRVCER